MKKNKFSMGLSLAILVAVQGAGLAHAQSVAVTKAPMANGNPIQPNNKRQKIPHSVRKTAAVLLKKKYKIELTKKMAEYVRVQGLKGGLK